MGYAAELQAGRLTESDVTGTLTVTVLAAHAPQDWSPATIHQ